MDANGVITITMNNLSVESAETVEVQFVNRGYQVVEAKIVTSGDMHDHNTFDAPEVVAEKDFTDYRATENGISVHLPANSVTEIRVSK
jgi:alpha-N-arabinofuranosidase